MQETISKPVIIQNLTNTPETTRISPAQTYVALRKNMTDALGGSQDGGIWNGAKHCQKTHRVLFVKCNEFLIPQGYLLRVTLLVTVMDTSAFHESQHTSLAICLIGTDARNSEDTENRRSACENQPTSKEVIPKIRGTGKSGAT